MMTAIYALGHFAVDFLCALLILGRFGGLPGWLTVTLYYNFLAFAMQMPLGVLADRLGRCRGFAALGAGLVCLAALPLGTGWTVALAGLGNACYHVGGGRETLLASRKAGPLGVFVAPGALGIFLGSLLRGQLLWEVLGAALLAAAGICIALAARQEKPEPRDCRVPGRKAIAAIAAAFLVVLLRSLVGMCASAPWKVGIWIPLGAVLGACGKALGGPAADRFGGGKAGGLSLLLAAGLFLLPEVPICGVLAGLLFQMSMPITLREASDRLPGGEGFVFGLMTFGLFLGFLPAQWGFVLSPAWMAGLAALSGLVLAWAAKGGTACNT